MGQIFSRKEQTPTESRDEQTLLEINTLRIARTEYQDTLSALQTNVETDIQKNVLTP